MREVQIVLSCVQHILQRGGKFQGSLSPSAPPLVTRLSMNVKMGEFEASLAS